MSRHPESYVALLRGVNVGGKNPLPMKGLVVALEHLGFEGLRTYIQSGNIVFKTAGASDAAGVRGAIEQTIQAKFGLHVAVVVRSLDELAGVVSGNPFLVDGAAPHTLYVGFMVGQPTKAAVASLDPARSSPDKFMVKGREVFLFCPNGLGRTKLTNDYFDRQLATTSTFRNWRTVTTLLDLARQ